MPEAVQEGAAGVLQSGGCYEAGSADIPERTLRLGFHYHAPASVSQDGRVCILGCVGRFIDSCARHCERLLCFLHTARSDEQLDYELREPNIELIRLGPRRAVPIRMLGAPLLARTVRSRRGDMDALLIRGPSPLLPAFARAAAPVPTPLLLIGDLLTGIADLPQPAYRKALIRLWATWNKRAQRRVARTNLVLVNSQVLYEEYDGVARELVETRTTTLNADDFYERQDTCAAGPHRILYVGRIDRAKGLLDITEAVALLVARGCDVRLDLVGWVQPGDGVLEELHSMAEQRGIRDRVHYHGFRSLGSELFAFYRQADLFVNASQSSEGFPRTIWEAMANSLPVVATRVGSIPSFLVDGEQAILAEPRSPDGLAAAMQRLLDQPELRRRIIVSARALVRENTLEVRSRQLMETIEDYLRRNRSG